MKGSIVCFLRDLFLRNGGLEYIGEEVSHLQHAHQSYQLALSEGADMELRVAAFLHDIGHMIGEDSDEYGVADHDTVGACWLHKAGFSERVVAVVVQHVNARRYLCRRFPVYYQKLSEVGKKSLENQGGVMTAKQADDFEQLPYFGDIVRVRQWDERAKDKSLTETNFKDIFDEINTVLTSSRKTARFSV